MNENDNEIRPISNSNIIFFFVVSGDDNRPLDGESDGEIEEPRPSCGDYVMHFLTLFWKIIFAFIPPTGNSSGNFHSVY